MKICSYTTADFIVHSLHICKFNETTTPTNSAGNARLQIIHAASLLSAKNTKVYITAPDGALSDPTPPALAYKGKLDYIDLTPGSYRIRLTPSNSISNVIIDSAAMSFEANKTYTAVISNPDAANANNGVTLLLDR
jgi:hypothetical protein